MGRAGGGSAGGHSSGGHGSSRPSGGHSMGSSHTGSSRPGSGSNRSGGSYTPHPSGGSRGGVHPNPSPGRQAPPPRGGHMPPPPPPRGRRRGFTSGNYLSRRYYSPVAGIFLAVIVVLIIIFAAVSSLFTNYSSIGSSSVPSSTVNREKLSLGISYDNNCIVDELGWVENLSEAEAGLKYFYEETGIQPYFVFLAYDSELATDDEKTAYAEEWYDANIANEGTFLVMYFAEEDTDNDVGYMAYVSGKQISSVIDSEAVEIFWAYLDEYWYSDLDTGDMLVQTFSDTADRIMEHTTTTADVMQKVVIVVIIVAACGGIICIMKVRRKHRKEENEEAERILNTPLSNEDPLLDKYSENEK